jgi:hypothetical protein
MNLYVYLQGGLGNQMFQYAAGLSALKEYPQFTKLCVDTSFYKNQDRKVIVNGLTGRNYDLDLLNIKYTTEDAPEGATMLQGWFQNLKEFENVIDEVKDQFQFVVNFSEETKKVRDKILAEKESIAIHVRRGDYITNPTAAAHHGVLEKEFYDKAIELMEEKYSNPHYFVFSEDHEWCKENIITDNKITFVGSECNDVKDSGHLYLMTQCKNHIIANSSYSWWGAFLGDSKYTIGPERWNKEQSGSEVMLGEWVKI